MQITAALPRAQLAESRIMDLLHFETLIVFKATRFVMVASGNGWRDLACPRAHGTEAALLAARAGYLAGFPGTAIVLENKVRNTAFHYACISL